MTKVTIEPDYDGYVWTLVVRGWKESGFTETRAGAYRAARRAEKRIRRLPRRAND